MKILSNKRYNELMIEIEVLKKMKNKELWDKRELEEVNAKLRHQVWHLSGVIAEQNRILDKLWYFDRF